jgi:hypothetical protein
MIAWLRSNDDDKGGGPFLLPRIGPIWAQAQLLGVVDVPHWREETQTGEETLQRLRELGECLQAAVGAQQKAPPTGNHPDAPKLPSLWQRVLEIVGKETEPVNAPAILRKLKKQSLPYSSENYIRSECAKMVKAGLLKSHKHGCESGYTAGISVCDV